MNDLIEVKVPDEQEGTKAVVRDWLKNPGDPVAVDDALVEIETDKVTQEIPSPATGTLEAILLESGSEALPGALLARIRVSSKREIQVGDDTVQAVQEGGQDLPPAAARHSPAVREAARLHGIDPAQVKGSGKDGRVTRMDMDAAIAGSGGARQEEPPQSLAEALESNEISPKAVPSAGSASRRVPHSTMRLAIADHMARSVATAPHVTAVFEADFSAIIRHRECNKEQLARQGISLSYTAYIVAASVAAMREVPEINGRWHDDCLEIFEAVNIGVGIALGDKGLIVPVIAEAQTLSLSAIAAKVQDLTNRARNNALSGSDVRGGTFTISNHGVSGSLLATPIVINQPQTAILGIGKLEKRVVVREIDGVDTIQIRPMAYVSLTIDHRAVDGYQTNRWMKHFVETLETWPSQ
ncbi:2-oxo acid dehydrogenase subunit E2 [Sinorhizobium sp. BG8]|uniref:dihydrolipoamide acetyltransferase family protein n=1 Tax=Sinorhizobium sp. BG8 TaxID=2613773 RepID=UPI00193CAB6B|nr:2-oxo acid dehydrogenase subunit E2 [Sinorhizobium sp. BG8]QRM57707.1 dihydrolipoamide succinyltransferase [Sinorhizobium sp. BG8]